jgi:tetratricopeptide (TPR) repeat protein
MRAALAVLLLPLLGTPVDAGDLLDEARQLFERGNMIEAARLAREEGSADGLALAAKATLVDAVYVAPEAARMGLLDQAGNAAREALALDPDHVDALLGLAMVLGHKAELGDPMSAYMSGEAEEGRALIERARSFAPDDAWPVGLLGIWHLQVVRHAGDALAGSLYDASREEGMRLCERALTTDPGATPIRFGCARSLLDIDASAYREVAMRELRKVVAAPADGAAGRLIQERASNLIRDLHLASR